jgi:DNA-binding transcriptional ArsR family regulator
MKEPGEFQECAERLKAVADPERLRILNVLFTGAKNVGQIAEALGEDIVKVSHHLSVLRRAKVLLATRRGRFIEYSLHPDVTLDSVRAASAKQIDFGCCRIDLNERKLKEIE